MYQFVMSGFSDEISPDFKEQLSVVTKLGIAYIEIRGVNGKNISDHSIEEVLEVKNELLQSKVGVSAIGSPIGKIKISDDFDPHFDKFKHTIEIAKVLDTKYIRMFSFFMADGTQESHRDEVMSRMSKLVKYAEQEDIILLHENEKDIYGDVPSRCLDLYKTMNSSHFKLIFDPANYVQCGVETYPEAFNELKDYVAYYHIKDANASDGKVVPSGFGDGHISEIISELKLREYKGFLSLEPHLGNFVGFSDLEGEQDHEFEEASDSSKFELAYNSLLKIISEV